MTFQRFLRYLILTASILPSHWVHGQTAAAPQGSSTRLTAVMYADTVLDYRAGFIDFNQTASDIVAPDKANSAWSLADEGILTFQFRDNRVMDGPGPDIRITAQTAPQGPLNAWISADGLYYIPLGDIGRTLEIDLNHKVPRGILYSHLRLRYQSENGRITILSANALNGPQVIVTATSALFETRTCQWTDRADQKLEEIIDTMAISTPSMLIIEAYSDNIGSGDYLKNITQMQADVLAAKLIHSSGIDPLSVVALGLGSNSPVGDNNSESGRKRNQRIRLLIYPPAPSISLETLSQ